MASPVADAKPPVPTDDYTLDDHNFDAELDADPRDLPPKPAAVTQPPAPTPARDESGKFTKQKHSPLLLQKASALGVTQGVLDEISPNDLGAYLAVTAWEQQQGRTVTTETTASRTPEPQPTPKANEPTTDEFNLTLSDDIHDDIRKAFTAVQSEIVRLRQLGTRLDGVEGYVKAQASEQATSQTDLGFEDLGAGFERVFGEGNGLALKGKPAFERRMQVITSLRANPIKDVSIRKAVAQRASELFADLAGEAPASAGERRPAPEPEYKPGPKPRFTPEQWNEAGLNRPTQRHGSAEPKGERRAAKAVANWMKDSNGTLDADLPDPELPE